MCGWGLSRVWYFFCTIAFFMALGFFMGVMTISFSLSIDKYKSLGNSENGWFAKILFKILNY